MNPIKFSQLTTVHASQSRRISNNDPSVGSPVVNEGRTRQVGDFP